MRKTATLTEGSIPGTLVRLAGPIIGANILQATYQATDTFWVGRLSANAVAAVALSFPINFLLIAIGGGLPIAGTVLVAQYKGRGDESAMNHVAAQTLLMVMMVSVVLSVSGFFLSRPIMRLMGAEPDVLPDAVRFLQVTFVGFIFVFGFFVFQSLMRGLGVVILPLLIVLGTVILNLILDPFFIFGYGPIPAMGVAGAALATLCTQALAAVVGFSLLFRGGHGFRLRVADFRPDLPFMRTAFRLGLPASVEQSTRAMGLTVMTLLVSSFGTLVTAAYGIGMRVLSFVIIPSMGLSMATSTLVAQNIGAGRTDRAERVTLIAALLSFCVLTAVGGVMFVCATPFAAFFMPEGGDAIPRSALFIRVMSLTFGFVGVQQVMTGTLRGAGNTLAAMVVAIVSLWVIQFPLAYTLSHHTTLGSKGIWWSFAISNVLAAIVTGAWFLRGDWKRKRLLDEIALEEKVREEAAIDQIGSE